MRITNWNTAVATGLFAAMCVAGSAFMLTVANRPSMELYGAAGALFLTGLVMALILWFTPLWIELGKEGVLVRRLSGAERLKWKELERLALQRQSYSVGVSVVDLPVSEHMFMHLVRTSGGGLLKVKVCRDEVLRVAELVQSLGQPRLVPA